MRCKHVQSLFSEIYDGIAEEQTILVEHLRECPICTAEYESYSRFMDELRQLPEPELPEGFHETVMAKIRAIAAENDDSIRELIEEIETRKRRKTAGLWRLPTKNTSAKALAVTRRWASVAAAACVLLISLWTMRVLDLPMRQANYAFDTQVSRLAPVDEMYNEMIAPAMEMMVVADEMATDYAPDMVDSEDIAESSAPAMEAPAEVMMADADMMEYDMENVEPDLEPVELRTVYPSLPQFDEDDDNLYGRQWAMSESEEEPHFFQRDENDEFVELAYNIYTPPGNFAVAGGDATDGLAREHLVLSVELPLTSGRTGSMAWTIAFAGGLVLLCVALVAMFINIRNTNKDNKAKKG